MNTAWSYSSLKTFQDCPKKYYHLKVAKDFVDKPTKATLYGNELHKAAEEFVKDGTPIPAKFDNTHIKPTLEQLMELEGERFCEYRMGLTKDLEPCGFFDKHVWWRGIADLLIVNREKGLAYSLDYKTGKSARYADVQQLDLVAEGVMAHFPEITRIKSGLLFVVSNEFVKAYQTADSRGRYMDKVKPDLHRLQSAFETGVWNASPNNLCGWCPVKTCEHNRG